MNKQPTGTHAINLLKPVGEANKYVRFGYIPHTIFYHIQGKVSGFINANKQVNNKKLFHQN